MTSKVCIYDTRELTHRGQLRDGPNGHSHPWRCLETKKATIVNKGHCNLIIKSTFAIHIFCSASSTQRHCSPEVQALVNQISCALWYGNTSKEALQVSNYSDLKLYITALKAMSSAVLLDIVMCGVVKKERFKHTLVQHCQAKACHPVFLFLFLGELTGEPCKFLRKKN